MAESGAIHIPQPIPDVNQLRPGQRPSTPLYGLRATPPVFRALVVGGNNSNVDLGTMRAAMIPTLPLPPGLLAPRYYAGARPSGQTVEFETQIAGIGAATTELAVTRSLTATIAGLGSLVAEIVRTRPLASGIVGSGSVVADQGGGTLGGSLTLTPETGDQTLTLTEETGDSQTLTSEDPPHSLTLTPA